MQGADLGGTVALALQLPATGRAQRLGECRRQWEVEISRIIDHVAVAIDGDAQGGSPVPLTAFSLF